jgi:TRAP-type C4-dicarboxylate transport system permease small subunit
MASGLRRVMTLVRGANAAVVVTLFVALVILALVSIVLRYVFNASLGWSEEAMRYLFIATTMLGAAYVVGTGQHIRLDVVHGLLPPRVRLAVDVVVWLTAMAFLVVVLFAADASWALIGRQRWATLPLPMRVAYAPIPIAAVLTMLYLLEKALVTLFGLRSTRPAEHP